MEHKVAELVKTKHKTASTKMLISKINRIKKVNSLMFIQQEKKMI